MDRTEKEVAAMPLRKLTLISGLVLAFVAMAGATPEAIVPPGQP